VKLFQSNLNPGRKELRWFAGLWFPAFWGVVGWSLLRTTPSMAFAIWTLTLVQAFAGLVRPPTIRPVYRFMLRVTFPIGWVLSHVIVAAAYFLIVTPIGYLMRFSHDPMRRTLERSAKSYWIDCQPVDRDRYFRQM
jgi:hypothetical protein